MLELSRLLTHKPKKWRFMQVSIKRIHLKSHDTQNCHALVSCSGRWGSTFESYGGKTRFVKLLSVGDFLCCSKERKPY